MPKYTRDTLIDNLCSHYKDTFDIHIESIKRRNKLLYALLSIMAIFIVSSDSPNIIENTIGHFIEKNYSININIYIDKIYTILWGLIFYVSLTYYQVLTKIEREYDYIHKIEHIISNEYNDNDAFTREGRSYLNNYPHTLNFVNILYKYILQIALSLCIIAKIYSEWSEINSINYYIIIDSIFCILTLVSVVFYIYDQKKWLVIIILAIICLIALLS